MSLIRTSFVPDRISPDEFAALFRTDGRCGLDAPDDWFLPLRVLMALWRDLYPRVWALVWANEFPAPLPGDLKPWLIAAIDMFSNNNLGSVPFATNMAELRGYLLSAAAVPIRFIGPEAHDYLLSDQGIDLFEPPDPNNWRNTTGDPVTHAPDKYFFGLYTHRSTGRPAMGVPGVLGDSAVVAPTGPAQIDVTPYLSSMITSVSARCISLDCYECAVARCWTLQGTVVGGIASELPRVAATIWAEDGIAGAPSGYGAKYALTTANELAPPYRRGIRFIFKERLETMLPEPNEMACEVRSFVAANVGVVNPVSEEIVFTRRGMFFPSLGKPPFAGMLVDIYSGNAANPVFTFSVRCT